MNRRIDEWLDENDLCLSEAALIIGPYTNPLEKPEEADTKIMANLRCTEPTSSAESVDYLYDLTGCSDKEVLLDEYPEWVWELEKLYGDTGMSMRYADPFSFDESVGAEGLR